jgi:signal transduction histidine kinase
LNNARALIYSLSKYPYFALKLARKVNPLKYLLVFFVFNFFTAFPKSIDQKSIEVKSFFLSIDSNNTLNQISKTTFTKSDNTNFSFGMSDKWNWIKLEIKSQDLTDEIAYVVIKTSMINELEFYLFDEKSKLIDSNKTGNHHVFDTRKYENKNFIFPFPIKNGETKIVYLKCKNKVGTLNVPVSVMNSKQFMKYENKDSFFVYLIYSVWFFASLVSLILYLLLHKNIYFYYFSYVFCMLLFWTSYDGFLFQLFWSDYPSVNDQIRDMYLLSAMGLSSFIYKILSVKNKQIPYVKAFLTYTHLSLAIVFVGQFFKLFYLIGITNLMVTVGDIGVALLGLMILFMIFYRIYQKEKTAYLFLLTTMPLWIYAILQMLSLRGLVVLDPDSIFTQYGFGLIMVFELILMFCLLIYKQLFLERENELFRKKLNNQNAIQQTIFDKEKEEIKKELHDQIGSNLFLMKLKLHELQQFNEKHADELEKLANLNSVSIDELRNILWVLHSQNIKSIDFYNKLRELVAKFRNMNQSMQFNLINAIEDEEQLLPHKKALQLLRVLQESVTNSIKHSKSEQIIIEFSLTKTHIKLNVSDFGVGLPEDYLAKGYGFNNMSKRIEESGGQFIVNSQKGEGVSILAILTV